MSIVRIPFVLVVMSAMASYRHGAQAAESSEIDSVLQAAVERSDVPGVVAMAATSERIIYRVCSVNDLPGRMRK